MPPYNFGTSGNILMKLFAADVSRDRGNNECTILGRLAPSNLGVPKKRPNFGAISDNFRLWSRISPEWISVSKTWNIGDQLQPLPGWTKETWWTLVHIRKSYRAAYWLTQVDIFRDTISALKGCCDLIFLHALEINLALLSHIPTGTGEPRKIIIVKI